MNTLMITSLLKNSLTTTFEFLLHNHFSKINIFDSTLILNAAKERTMNPVLDLLRDNSLVKCYGSTFN